MFRGDDAMDAAASGPGRLDFHPSRVGGADQVIEQPVGHVFVENPEVPEGLKIELEALELDARLVGDVAYAYGAEVRLAGLGAQAGELMSEMLDEVIPLRMGVIERLELL